MIKASIPGMKQLGKVCLDDANLVAIVIRYTEEAGFFKLFTFHLSDKGKNISKLQ